MRSISESGWNPAKGLERLAPNECVPTALGFKSRHPPTLQNHPRSGRWSCVEYCTWNIWKPKNPPLHIDCAITPHLVFFAEFLNYPCCLSAEFTFTVKTHEIVKAGSQCLSYWSRRAVDAQRIVYCGESLFDNPLSFLLLSCCVLYFVFRYTIRLSPYSQFQICTNQILSKAPIKAAFYQ